MAARRCRGGVADPGAKEFHFHGPGEVEALCKRTAGLEDEFPLAFGLDPLGNDRHSQASREIRHQRDDGDLAGVLLERHDI